LIGNIFHAYIIFDAEFLARESARADKLLADLGQCQAAYTNARAAIGAVK